MKIPTILLASTLVFAALAGCADDAGDAPATTTPAATTPTTTTPATTPMTTPTGDLDPDFGSEPLVCAAPSAEPEPIGERMGYPQLVVTVEEPSGDDPCYQFVAPESVEAGWTAVTLRNNGMAPHIMPMFFLADNHTFEDFLAVADQSPPPAWVVPVGGVGFATPFESGTVLMDLQEGTYVLACFFAGHHTQGMLRALNVTASEDEPRDAPEETLTFTLEDFAFGIPENITAGEHVVKFVNNGTQPHEAPLIKLNEGVTIQQFLEAVENPQGPPPGSGVGGVNMLAPGDEAFALVTFEAGDYGFVCFVESPAHDGAPHVALGMVAQFRVDEAEAGDDATNTTA